MDHPLNTPEGDRSETVFRCDCGRVHDVPFPQAGSPAEGPLSPFQMRVLSLVAQGQTEREISDTLGTGYHQVRHAARESMDRLGARTRAAAVFRAASLGFLPASGPESAPPHGP